MRSYKGLAGFAIVFVLSAVLTTVYLSVTTRNHPPAIVGISPDTGARFARHEVAFHAEAEDPEGENVHYHWDFGDGTSSSLQNPRHRYAQGGDYTVTLTISDDRDARRTTRFRIHINQPPQAVASADPTGGEPPLTVRFDGSASVDPDGGTDGNGGTGLKYRWDFGDGGHSSIAEPVHRYEKPGEYTATLIVEDDEGATDRAQIRITVRANEAPIARFRSSKSQGLVGDAIGFDGTPSRDPDGGIISYEWDFDGDDRPDARGLRVTHRFSEAGRYQVKLTVTDDGGKQGSTVEVVQIVAPRSPVARFTFAPSAPHVGDEVSFDAEDSTSPDSHITQYDWDFDGDGRTDSQGAHASFRFRSSGKQRVTLTVTDHREKQDRLSREIRILPRPQPNQAPVARLSLSTPTPSAGERATLSASGSYDRDGRIVRYEWDLDGDGEPERTTSIPQLKVTFRTAGRYKIAVNVVDDQGDSNAVTMTVQVEPGPVGPTPSFLSGGVAFLGQLTLYRGGIGVHIEPAYYGEFSFSYGEGEIRKGGYPLAISVVGLEYNVLSQVTQGIFVGPGIGLLVISGNYEIDWPVRGSKSFTLVAPVINLKIGYELGFLMLTAEVSYPVVLQWR